MQVAIGVGRASSASGEAAVAPVVLRLPGVAFDRQPEPAELAEHDRARFPSGFGAAGPG